MSEHIEILDGDAPPEPIPVPASTVPGESFIHCKMIAEFLERSGLDLRGCTPKGLAEYIFCYCQGCTITQSTIDLSLRRHSFIQKLSELADEG